MPKTKWDGYNRFCPLATGLDVIGERWTLVIIHNLLRGPTRYNGLKAGLPGIGTNVLADRLRKLETAGVVRRTPGAVGDGVAYELTDRGQALAPVMAEIRRWGADELLKDSAEQKPFDLTYGIPEELGLHETYEWRIDGRSVILQIEGQVLTQNPDNAGEPAIVVEASAAFMRRWAAGETTWQEGRSGGEVTINGPETAWDRMLVATSYPATPPELIERLLEERSAD